MIWIDLVYNLALLVALSVVSGFVDTRWKRETWLGAVLQGVLFGGAAMIGMLRPFAYAPGLIFDGRSVMISLAGLFFGPWSAAVACLMTVALRLAQGGPGMAMGVLVILTSAAIGVALHRRRRQSSREIAAATLLGFGLVVHLAMLVMTLALPTDMILPVLKRISLPVIITYPLATVLIGKILSDQAVRAGYLESLLESERRYRALFESSPDGAVILNPQTARPIQFNDRAHLQLGYSREEFAQLSLADIDIVETPQQILEHIRSVMSGERADFETRHRTKQGEIRNVHVTAQRLHVSERAVYHCVWRDITERKQAEEENEKLQAQLIHAQKMESVGRLAGGVAHDFNNMLQVILGNTSLALLSIPPESPLREHLEEIEKSAQRSADLTRQLLTFARKQTIAPKVLDLNEAVAGMLKMLRRLIGEDIDLVWQPGADLGLVNMDPTQVDQILANLCVNARDAIGTAVGKVTIETANAVFDEAYMADHPEVRVGEYVRLAVSDNGCGISPEVKAHLFEPFFTTKTLGQGTGLGLATVYGIVKQNHGFINVWSETGRGTTFQIHLPRHEVRSTHTASEKSAPSMGRGHETILLVEDEPSILRMSRQVLANLGYKVLAASKPGDAIELASEHAGEIHLLITDVVMPNMNGRDLARSLLSQHPNLRCLFISGYTANVIAPHGVLDSGVHFLQKPFSVEALAAKVREALKD